MCEVQALGGQSHTVPVTVMCMYTLSRKEHASLVRGMDIIYSTFAAQHRKFRTLPKMMPMFNLMCPFMLS